MLVSSTQAVDNIVRCIRAGLVPMVSGSPGIGKSDIVRSIAKNYKLELIDVRLSQCDPTDLSGFPTISEGYAQYVPMKLFPLEKTPIPKGKTGFLIFLDEFNSSSLAVQAASYKLILDKTVGQHKLHPKAAIVAAGNLSTDGAITNRVSTATQSRLIHLELGVVAEDWIEWASKHGIDHRIIAYIHSRPENLHKFDPKHHDKTFSCPRTWEFTSKLIKNYSDNLHDLTALLAGTVSEAVAKEFIMYTTLYSDLPSISEIVSNPLTTKIDDEPSMLYALAHMIAVYTNKTNLPALMQFVDRLPLEFGTITVQSMLRRDAELIKEKPIRTWSVAKGSEIFLG